MSSGYQLVPVIPESTFGLYLQVWQYISEPISWFGKVLVLYSSWLHPLLNRHDVNSDILIQVVIGAITVFIPLAIVVLEGASKGGGELMKIVQRHTLVRVLRMPTLIYASILVLPCVGVLPSEFGLPLVLLYLLWVCLWPIKGAINWIFNGSVPLERVLDAILDKESPKTLKDIRLTKVLLEVPEHKDYVRPLDSKWIEATVVTLERNSIDLLAYQGAGAGIIELTHSTSGLIVGFTDRFSKLSIIDLDPYSPRVFKVLTNLYSRIDLRWVATTGLDSWFKNVIKIDDQTGFVFERVKAGIKERGWGDDFSIFMFKSLIVAVLEHGHSGVWMNSFPDEWKITRDAFGKVVAYHVLQAFLEWFRRNHRNKGKHTALAVALMELFPDVDSEMLGLYLEAGFRLYRSGARMREVIEDGQAILWLRRSRVAISVEAGIDPWEHFRQQELEEEMRTAELIIKFFDDNDLVVKAEEYLMELDRIFDEGLSDVVRARKSDYIRLLRAIIDAKNRNK